MKQRLDKLVSERGFTDTRTKAQALIIAGQVRVNGEKADKPGTMYPDNCEIEVVEKIPWVSRGAFKLLRAFDAFPIDVTGKTCADIGASTGGFVEVLLTRGARYVYAVDVGYGQLAWKLASDPRVCVMDRTNGRELSADSFNTPIEFITTDASFISLKLLLPAIERSLTANGEAVALIKPQFEAGKERVGKGGIVRSSEVHTDILTEVTTFISEQTKLSVMGLAASPIKGQKGNKEFLCHLSKRLVSINIAESIEKAIEESAESGNNG